jgi:hypothetical protein
LLSLLKLAAHSFDLVVVFPTFQQPSRGFIQNHNDVAMQL